MARVVDAGPCDCCEESSSVPAPVVTLTCPCGAVDVPRQLFLTKTGDTCGGGAWDAIPNGTTWELTYRRVDSLGVSWWGADLASICTGAGGETCRWLMLGVECDGLTGLKWRAIMTDDAHGGNGVLDPVICGANGLFVFTDCSPTYPLTGFGLTGPWSASCCNAGQVDFELMD